MVKIFLTADRVPSIDYGQNSLELDLCTSYRLVPKTLERILTPKHPLMV